MRKIILSKRGEGYIDTAVIVLASVMVIALALAIYPVVISKHELNTFADEVRRQAEIAGQVGAQVNTKIQSLKEETGLDPAITWDANFLSGNRIQINDEFTVSLSHEFDFGFGPFGSWPITLKSKATGKSEVYW
ncbi:DUF4320 family protein [Desulfosporosinus nitroreducens]|uniref:DUF4320 family protein n=1 Tax=Desulfosporosinus nitroreducens TaxID=2018668 RepID=A0ABT8QRV7_9FIRM|nr:DUF4320 family protein [Desulfosporosinus nitroreducens]MDO0824082.1 DUF4320 family protein [Desulfosporosinus nitroreducens]